MWDWLWYKFVWSTLVPLGIIFGFVALFGALYGLAVLYGKVQRWFK